MLLVKENEGSILIKQHSAGQYIIMLIFLGIPIYLILNNLLTYGDISFWNLMCVSPLLFFMIYIFVHSMPSLKIDKCASKMIYKKIWWLPGNGAVFEFYNIDSIQVSKKSETSRRDKGSTNIIISVEDKNNKKTRLFSVPFDFNLLDSFLAKSVDPEEVAKIISHATGTKLFVQERDVETSYPS